MAAGDVPLRPNIHTCNICLYNTKSLYFMNSHLKKHRNEDNSITFLVDLFECSTMDLYRCEKCDFSTHLIVDLNHHDKMVHQYHITNPRPMITNNYNCKNCKFATFSLLVFAKHSCPNYFKNRRKNNQVEYLVEKLPFNCEICGFRTFRKKYLTEHQIHRHVLNGNINCNKIRSRTKRRRIKTKSKFSKKITKENLTTTLLHKCQFCPLKVKRKTLLKIHTEKEHSVCKPFEFKCELCPFKTLHKGSLRAHRKYMHTPPEELHWFQCELCQYKTKRNHDFRLHMTKKHPLLDKSEKIVSITMTSSPSHKCELCPLEFKRKAQLKSHVDKKHSVCKPNEIKCELCQFKTLHKSSLRNHRKYMHTPPEEIAWIKCELCDYKAKRNYDFKVHMVKKHPLPDDGKPEENVSEDFVAHNCQFCSLKFKRKTLLKIHVDKQHSISQFKCEKTSLKSHRKSKHSLTEEILCPYKVENDCHKIKAEKKKRLPKTKLLRKCHFCPSTFQWKSQLKIHVAKKHACQLFKCNQCPFKTMHKGSFRAHEKLMHTPPEQMIWFECKLCVYKAKRKSNLTMHTKKNHRQDYDSLFIKNNQPNTTTQTVKKLHSCQQCLLEFKRKSSLEKHKSQHKIKEISIGLDENGVYRCQVCPFQGKRKSILNVHFDMNHSVVWFYCDKCKFKTKRKRYLKQHQLFKHTESGDIKWFRCECCPYQVKNKHLLVRHKSKEHRLK